MMRLHCCRPLTVFILFQAVFVLFPVGAAWTSEPRTSLIIEGGGLPAYCPALERLVETARIDGKLRIGYLPTASSNPDRSASRFVLRLSPYGIQPDQIQILDLSLQNAAVKGDDPQLVAQILDCTAIFLGGGDQTRITRALLKPDGKPTAAMKAILTLRERGGVIAGTSAGAAAQSETMISVSGFPDDLMDDGMDALDFGLTTAIEQPARRGLLVSRGLGFLRNGIVDQHFSQYRGRLGRLARAAIESQIRFGFGIDEDAAMVVATDGTIEVLGPGHLTIVDTKAASLRDSALGCSLTGIHLTCLGHGDRFDPATGQVTIHPNKKPIEPGHESNNGNFPIPDIAGRGAVLHALIDGLANNTCRKQIGIALKHHRHHGHGYRHIFSKTEQTHGYEGVVNGVEMASITHVRLDIEPVSVTLNRPETALPRDLPQGSSREPLAAIVFRGIMLADTQNDFRPDARITRGELASAIAQTLRLELPRENPPRMTDIDEDSPEAHDIALVVAAGLMQTEGNAFRPSDSLSRQEGATVLVRLAERYRSESLAAKPADFSDADAIDPIHRQAVLAACHSRLLKTDDNQFRPTAPLTRGETAAALYSIIGFPWAD
jgi:cyanophycinase